GRDGESAAGERRCGQQRGASREHDRTFPICYSGRLFTVSRASLPAREIIFFAIKLTKEKTIVAQALPLAIAPRTVQGGPPSIGKTCSATARCRIPAPLAGTAA